MSKCLQALRDAEAEDIGEYFHSYRKTNVGKIKSTCSNYLRIQEISKCTSHLVSPLLINIKFFPAQENPQLLSTKCASHVNGTPILLLPGLEAVCLFQHTLQNSQLRN